MPQTTHQSQRKPTLKPKFLLGLALIVALALIGINEIAYQGARQAAAQDFSKQDRRFQIHDVALTLLDAQTSLRGYFLSNKPSYLEQYQRARTRLNTELKDISQFGSDGDNAALIAFHEEVLYQASEMDVMLRLHDKQSLDAIQFLLDSAHPVVTAEGLPLLRPPLDNQHSIGVQSARENLMLFLLLSRFGILGLTLLALVVVWLYLREMAARQSEDENTQKRLTRQRDALERLVRQRTASLSDLASHFQQVSENERSHLARELHDELGALLTAAKLDMARLRSRLDMTAPEIAERITHLSSMLNQVIALKRKIVEDLHPSTLETLGLNSALENLTHEFTKTTSIPVESVHESIELAEYATSTLRLTVYRVIQESLNNIAKYANASLVHTYVQEYPSYLRIRIIDDGVGFDPNEVNSTAHGIRGMRHRIEALGGSLTVQSAHKQGTHIIAIIPKVNAMESAGDAVNDGVRSAMANDQ